MTRRRLVLWRHGQTGHNAKGIWQGHLDVPLSHTGLEQARRAAVHLAKRDPVEIISSDLARAAMTAQALGDLTGLPVTIDKRLREIDVGDWSGRSGDEVRARYGDLLDRIDAGEDLPRGGSGETVEQMLARSRPCIDELLARLPAGRCAVVATHGMTSRSLAAWLVDIDQTTAWRSLTGLGNCRWSTLVESRTGWRIEGWNACR